MVNNFNENENEISKLIVDACFKIHKKLGQGLFESAYEKILAYELEKIKINYVCQKELPLIYDSIKIDLGFRADLIIENKVIVELKSVERILPVHKKQLLTYLKITGIKLGLLVNFNADLIKNGITRIINGILV